MRRALLSVFDKTGLVELGQGLSRQGVELLSTGGSARTLREAGIQVTDVSEVTGFPEILDGRVKTLHPLIHGGLLARRNDPEDQQTLGAHGIPPIDLVVVNLYPFSKATADPETTDAIAIENIDIGGPTMIRAAAKNFFYRCVVTDPGDYHGLLEEMEANGGAVGMATRRRLAHKAFSHTAGYDAAIDAYFSRAGDTAPAFRVTEPLSASLRYGENPHQAAALYGDPGRYFTKHHGKDLSFNNILDLSAALRLIREFAEAPPTCAILKHTNPCGVGTADGLMRAYERAFATDRQSPFGGIVVVNRALDLQTAEAINKVFTEIIIAPDYEEDAMEFLRRKKNRRLITFDPDAGEDARDVRSVVGGFLIQDLDPTLPDAGAMRERVQVVTERQPTPQEWQDLDFAWRVAKHVKSNAIVYARNGATVGIGAGQMSRIDASEIAVSKGAKSELDFAGSVVASDAFFPFADGLVEAAQAGARAAIQPGGSVRDEEVIAAANERGIAMVFTGQRHFRH
ncbi:MAG: bifunctional phosphoribosylaminoimidazolecarboxamide formyltransferase/IMP cyclohydrolase [Rhodothermales bacterium]|nr:bifunctional phosphoribosylaminoimidazolecarboxamide formyltransferase/IMP cyclohydrolase [Rhodothermales bacterium]MBO6779789.1 bifunctional phosphoribosylaminoimidazolecarboxamide formyltransferase/IMP cyclohydrolase [Rhodothermales bacterium]